MPLSNSGLPEWLSGYASDVYDWHKISENDGRTTYWRRMGMVEGLFHCDGADFEGRADLNMNLRIEVRTSLPLEDYRQRIAKAWSIFRQQHILVSAAAAKVRDFDKSGKLAQARAFVFRPSMNPRAMLDEGNQQLVFVGDDYPDLDVDDFYTHITNSARAIDGSVALAKLHVMPFAHSTTSSFGVHFMLIAAHQIVDGLTTFAFMNSFIDVLNLTDLQLDQLAKQLCREDPTSRLPPAQETLYPPIQGSLARQRWFWAITRILRHTKKLNPPAFLNPVYRNVPLPNAVRFPPKYDRVLDYSRVPPLNNYHVNATLSSVSTARLRQLCREASISVGSGLFALVAITMMLLHEKRCPDIPLEEREPFIGSFPVNPRPFLASNPPPDSLMLAFSEGIAMPFLPSDLPFEGRFRLLGKIAHRKLKIYQKRKRTLHEEAALGTQSGAQLLPSLYCSTTDRLEMRSKPEDRMGWDLQGPYAIPEAKRWGTCGISSVGDRSGLIRRGRYDVSGLPEGKDTVVDFRDLGSTVRARDGEFLVGAAGEKDWLGFGVSYDGCAVDPKRAEEWKRLIEGILEDGGIGGRKDGELAAVVEKARL